MSHASDNRHRPVGVPLRLFTVCGSVQVRDAPKTDCLGGLHALFEQPDSEIADFHGASERRQVHENQTVFDRDGVRSAISKRDERCGVLPFQLACLGYGKLCDPDNEPLPCPLQTLQHRQIRAQIVAGRGLDVAVSELACDH